jgi:hypothetical protein
MAIMPPDVRAGSRDEGTNWVMVFSCFGASPSGG